MWYQGYLDKVGPDGRIRTDLRQTGTISMRSSSQRVNLQALPHDYRLEAVEGLPSPRSLFVPAPGMLLYELDLSQAELRHAAKAAKCETILALLRAGEDVHGSTASRLFGVTASDGTWKQYRNVAKRANFSAIFGIGAPKFNVDVEKQTGVKLGEARAGEILTAWRSLYPEFQVAMARAERLAIKRGWIKLAGGRLRWFAPYESPHKAFNQYVQGSLAQAKKRWMVEVDRELPGTLVLEVHDSLVEEVWSEAEAKRAAVIGEQVCSEFLGVPMLVDVKQWK
jgi:DNA polymerase-1